MQGSDAQKQQKLKSLLTSPKLTNLASEFNFEEAK